MNLGSMRKTMIKSAKAQLDRHKSLGQRSTLSILQVAELLDFVTGKNDAGMIPSGVFLEGSFSMN